MNGEHDLSDPFGRKVAQFTRPVHCPGRAHVSQPSRQHPPKAHQGRRYLSQFANDGQAVYISADRLRRWKAELDYIETLRDAIKSISMSHSEKVKLFAPMTQLKGIVGGVKDEIMEKLRT